ncbi:hypothetical protein K0U00_42965, partial [Paenibacillus sepulcri]|nr:hypothetical protein [Paenibacillus sepulcri]
IEACHSEGIRFIARFDFSKADDGIYQRRPQWFVRNRNGEPHISGSLRPGPWSLLMSTCINTPYRNESVAIPVLDEVLSNYKVDGIFFNAPQYLECYCDFCRRKYRERYGRDLPGSSEQFEPDWASASLKDNMSLIYSFVKEKAPDLPMILYYFYKDDLHARAATSDIMCTEAQNILSRGHKEAPEFWVPAANVKIGRTLIDKPAAFGIVHSSPGMDWRHTGLPAAEYLFWMSQVPAHGGQIWHSLTGIPDTITDKRIL